MVKDKEPGTFVVRDSTSYRGSFGLAMKVDQISANITATAYPGKPLLVSAATWPSVSSYVTAVFG